MKKVVNDAERGRELMRRIQAVGIPIIIPTATDEWPALLICQDFEGRESMIFGLNGGAGLVLSLRAISTVPVFVLSDFHVELPPWPDVRFQLVEEADSAEWRHYEFHGRPELKFNRDEVINRFITERKVMRRDYPVRGLLLAFSPAPMPADIQRGEKLEGFIKIYDQFEQTYSANIRLRVEGEAVREPRLTS
jgi:hypothetical protein